jgi:integrase
LQFTILTLRRSGEALRATWDEISFDKAIWTVPSERMKTSEKHEAPLGDAALGMLYAQREARSENPHVFLGDRPTRPLSAMAMPPLM